ncbi:MAG TPA: 4Fe-4S binding protein [Planctomycetota bacterium]|nr:4Fe-4S binding protein [Planctomycetota bacterium]
MPKRKIVRIDAAKCNGCGQCVSACAEGAIAMVNGKAKLVKDSYCDGLGACLGECPQDAITIEEREAADFDEAAAMAHKHGGAAAAPHAGEPPAPSPAPLPCGCPGTMARTLKPAAAPAAPCCAGGSGAGQASQLGQWPIQLALVPPGAPFLRGRELALAADCVGFAFPQLHPEVLAGRALLVACPKLDDVSGRGYVEKLAEIFRGSGITKVTVYRMEVPCCSGLTRLARQALADSGAALPFEEVVIGLSGEVAG